MQLIVLLDRMNYPSHPDGRVCEYNDGEIKYWVNTRTMGTLSREDMQSYQCLIPTKEKVVIQ